MGSLSIHSQLKGHSLQLDTSSIKFSLIGDSLQFKNQQTRSYQFYQKALKKLKAEENWEGVLSMYLKISKDLNANREFQKSSKILLEGINLVRDKRIVSDSLKALSIHNLGSIYLRNQQFKLAIQYLNEAISLRLKLFTSDHPDITKGYHNLGQCYKYLNEVDSTIYYLKKSINNHPIPPYHFVSRTYRVLSRVYSEIGDFKRGEDYLELALKINKERRGKQEWLLLFYSEMTFFYLETEQYAKTIEFANEGIKKVLGLKKKSLTEYLDLIHFYNSLGLSFTEVGEYEKAIQQFKKAQKLGEKYWDLESLDIAHNYSNIGYCLILLKAYEQANYNLLKANEYYSLSNSTIDLARNTFLLGDLFFDQRKYKEALINYRNAINNLIPNYLEQDIYSNPALKDHYIPDKQALLIFLEAKAKTFKALYDQNNQEKDLKSAHETYQLLDELIDNIRLSYLEDASKSYLVKQAKPIYEKAIGLCLQYHEYSKDEKYLAEAFKYAEKSKAIILLEQIKESRANIAASIPDSVQQKERQLKREIGQIEKELALQGEEVTTDSLGKSLREQLIRVKNEYEDLVKNLEKNNKEYHQLKYDLQTVDIQTIQREVLKEGQQLVEYFVGEDSMFLFSIGKGHFKVISQRLDFDLKAWTDSLRQGIYYCRINNTTTNETCEALDRQYEACAVKLYQKLIAPLKLTVETKEIIFIPDGVLGYIPFDALLTKAIPDNQRSQFKNYPYFGLEKVINYAFSATFLKELQQTIATIDNHQLLAFAPSFKVGIKEGGTLKVPPSLEAQDPIFALRSSLSPLLFNEREVEQIEANFSGKSYINQQANKLSFIREAPNYRYLHIASHGKMNDEDADLSYIAFTQDGDSTNQEELLYLRELYDMDIPADMVVLSACETGIGELQNGEGIISLARGFSYAGAKSIITSLWSVNDQKTTDLMVDFYQNLKEGQTKNYALANAKRDYIKDQKSATFSHPFYWAGFIPIGNMDRVEAASDWTWLLYGLGGISILAGFIFWRSKRTKRKASPIAA